MEVELHRAAAKGDHKAALVAATKLIAAGTTSPEVLQAKVVAALHLDQFQDALDAAGTAPTLAFHRAYALYKLDRLAEATAALEGAAVDKAAADLLRAQIQYRGAAFASAADVYGGLVASLRAEEGDASDVHDAQLNLIAACVSGGDARGALSHPQLSDIVTAVGAGTAASAGVPYELVFNVSCALLDAGDAPGAAAALEQSLSIGADFLRAEGGSDEGAILKELHPLRAQAALLLAGAHYDEAAAALLDAIMGGGGRGSGRRSAVAGSGRSAKRGGAAAIKAGGGAALDIGTAALLRTNLAQLRPGLHELADVYKVLTAALGTGGNAASSASGGTRLTRRQELSLLFNRALLLYQMGRASDAQGVLKELDAALVAAGAVVGGNGAPYAHPLRESCAALRVLIDAALASSDKARPATRAQLETAFAAAASASPVIDAPAAPRHVSPALAAHVQLLVADGRTSEAAALLRERVLTTPPLPHLPAHPSVAATVAQLLTSTGDAAGALAVLSESATAWTAAVGSSAAPPNVAACAATALSSLAGFLAAKGDAAEAARKWSALAALRGAPPALAGAALSCLAVTKLREGSGAEEAHKLISQARTMVGTTASSSSATLQMFPSAGGVDVDALEAAWGGPQQQQQQPLAAAGGEAAFRSSKEEEATIFLARLAARSATRRAKAKRRRDKARAAFVAKLVTAGKFDTATGLPRPDPERWVPKAQRAKAKRKGGVSAGVKGGLGSQGVAEVAGLDARARGLKTAAAAAAAAPSAAGGAAAAAAGAKSQAKGKKK